MWASLTLALLTLPVVIVTTEEAWPRCPNSMREGSYACGASKWQTIRRIVLPRAMPGIMTGMILAMARGAGEVAPLMLVGVKDMAPALPVDGVFPFVHPQRSFMHLAYQIYHRRIPQPERRGRQADGLYDHAAADRHRGIVEHRGGLFACADCDDDLCLTQF